MDKDELRIKTYEYLGLAVGSLLSEGGNDWVRAEKEILADYKREQFEKMSKDKKIEYSILDKTSEEFQFALTTMHVSYDNYKILISSRNDLDDSELECLINTGSKDVHINIARTQKLSEQIIDILIPKSVYLVKKYLIDKQQLTKLQKQALRPSMEIMMNIDSMYWESDDVHK